MLYPKTVHTVEAKLKQTSLKQFHKSQNKTPRQWNVLANHCRYHCRCLRAKPDAGAGRWRVRDVVVVSAG